MQSNIKVNLIAFIGSLLWYLLDATYRWDIKETSEVQRDWASKEPVIIMFWHGHQIFMPKIHRWSASKCKAREIFALISQHSDGRIAARLCELLGAKSVAGSTSSGGAKALVSLIKLSKSGNHTAITPDGPKGPIYEVKPGVVKLAQKTQAALVPTAISASSYWELKSWDRMIIPKPFAKVSLLIGEVIRVPEEMPEEDLAKWQSTIKERLDNLS